MSTIAFAVSLPEHVERFDPLRRRFPGSEFVLLPGRWPSKRWNSRQATRRALVEHGSPPVVDVPANQFELLLSHGETRGLDAFLSPGGRTIVWRDGMHPVRSGPAVWGAAPAWHHADAPLGDPRLDRARDASANDRAQTALGIQGSSRPLLVAVFTRPLTRAWGQALAQLRTDWDIAVDWRSSACVSAPVPRVLTGPGVVAAGHLGAPALAAADLVVSDHPVPLWDAISLGLPALGLCEGGFRHRDLALEAAAAPLAWEGDPTRLPATLREGWDRPDPASWPRFCPSAQSAAAAVAAELGSYQSRLAGVR